ncbi:MAG: cytochrome c biogenesis protein CcsA [Pseudomonadota bacterium]|nr:cytochrome c biogenesis protein CcsA [Pseudomonadota bacterium]
MFQFIAVGFVLLSLALLTGFAFLHDIFAQHLVHKTVLSIAAWIVFAILLWGRWRFGWRGRTAIRWTLGGVFVLMLAYFGSKLVLELVLHRV